jgi:hypothetical protein
MNKEQIIDGAYVNYGQKIISDDLWMLVAIGWPSTQEEFINKCKTDPEFSEKWGLKIEERELTDVERYTIARQYGLCPKYSNIGLENCTEEEHYNKFNVPTKLITITHNDKTIESYE